jgi:DNA-binding NtrC family response regulator
MSHGDAAKSQVECAPGSSRSVTPRPTVVLVDGNPFQRGQNAAALRRAGFDTIALAAPGQALSLCDLKTVRIEALVVTSSYGAVRGLDLVRELRTRRSSLPALVIWESREPPPADLHGVAVLLRPYETGRLTEEVMQLLGSRVRGLPGRDDERATSYAAGARRGATKREKAASPAWA